MEMLEHYPENVVWRPQAGSQEAFLGATPIFEVLYQGTRGGGKCVADRTKVLTSKGWKRADEIISSDLLIAEDGTQTQILGIFPQEEKQMYEVTFWDGQKIVCGHDHKWKLISGKNGNEKVHTTEWLYNRPDPSNWSVPYMGGAAEYGEEAPLDPYIVGLIVGDGTIHQTRDNICIYNQDEDVLNYLEEAGWKIVRYEGVVPRAYLKSEKEAVVWKEHLKECCPGDGKKFPSWVMNGNPSVRLEALRGLMDSDGSVDDCGRAGFTTISPYLMDQGMELAWSLGGKANVSVKNFGEAAHGESDRFYFSVSISWMNKFNPFKMKRKADKISNWTVKKGLKRRILSVRKVDSEKSRCFAVYHHSHCFIIEGWVVTHNTDCLIMSFAIHTGKGYGSAWKGILFRQTYKQLTDVITKTKKWFPQIFPEAKFNNSEHVWTFPGGEQLLLRQFKKEDDYWNYHGHEYPWIGWEELCNWADDAGYKRMFSCCRSSTKGLPRMVRATTNPYGPGHNWVKDRFLPDRMNMKVRKDLVDDEGRTIDPRLSIFSNLHENKILLASDPNYITKIAASARNEAERKAWLEGSWDIVSGGMFSDVFDQDYNVVDPFDIPDNWTISRSFDWGSSKPFSVGWWAKSNGEDVKLRSGRLVSTVRGDLFRIMEWYGSTGKPNEGIYPLASDISKGIVERELRMGWRDPANGDWCRVRTGVADAQIFSAENGNCIATDMRTKVRLESGVLYKGIQWHPADKRAGSRITGWDQMRRMLRHAHPNGKNPREKPGLFVFSTCAAWLKTVPVLPRDQDNMDDVDSDAEDHTADDTRYFVRFQGASFGSGVVTGNY